MFERTHIKEGMVVHSQDGHRLGRVLAAEDDGFQIEKGLFFVKDYACDYSEIADIRDQDIYLKHGKEALQRIRKDVLYGPHAHAAPGTGPGHGEEGVPSGPPRGGGGHSTGTPMPS